MAGLRLMAMGGVSTVNPPSYTGAQSASTVTQAAFGPGATVPAESLGSILTPNDPFGVCFWGSVIAVGLLCLIRHSLPR